MVNASQIMGAMSHRYAAVLAADVAQFSRLMERDGDGTVRALQRCRTEFRECVSSFNGREFGSVGDSLMAEFGSPVEALRAARDCQQRITALRPIDESGSKLALKIGLHAGDVIVEGDTLFGDVVNIASRLQAMARPGEIVLSNFVYRQVRKEKGFAFRSLGRHRLKNISEPVLIYRVVEQQTFSLRRVGLAIEEYRSAVTATLGVAVAAVLFAWYLATRDHPSIVDTTISLPADNTIAVLPFEVCDDQVVEESLAGGLTAAVHGRLAQRRPQVVAKSQASVRTVIETGPPFSETSRLLGVENLLHGALCRDSSNRLTIQVELLDADGFTKWQQDYQQVVDRTDQVQVQLATLIENGVATELGDKSESEPDVTVDRRALEQLLIAQDHRQQGQHDEARAAIEKALEIEPDYTEARIELAVLTIISVVNRTILGDAIKEAIEIGERALGLAKASVQRNPGDFQANWLAGQVSFGLASLERDLAYWDFESTGDDEIAEYKARAASLYADAERYLSAALSSNPGDTDVRLLLVETMDRLGINSRSRSLEILQEGLRLDPYNAELTRLAALRLAEVGRLRDAMDAIDAFERLPQGKGAGLALWQIEIAGNYRRYDEKLVYLIELLKTQPDVPLHYFLLPGHLWWFVSQLAELGLYEEASSFYELVAEFPWSGRPPGAKQLFLDDFLGFVDGRWEEVADRRLENIAGKSNEEILAEWAPTVWANIRSFYLAEDLERAIELMEAYRHRPMSPSNWSERQMSGASFLAQLYMEAGRDAEATELWREFVAYRHTEVDAGVRHPVTLGTLAIAYGWLGETELALETLDMAVDSGAFNMHICCEDYFNAKVQHDFAEYRDDQWWHGLEDHPDLSLIRTRMRSNVDAQRATIRALLAQNDMESLIANMIKVREAKFAEAQ